MRVIGMLGLVASLGSVTACALAHQARIDGGVVGTDARDSIDGFVADADVATDVPADTACTDGQLSCEGRCLGPTESAQHCGSCGNDCSALANVRGAATVCASNGTCDIHAACQPGYADCDNDATNGCERALGSRTDCASCGDACSGATPVCAPTSPGMSACTDGCTAGMTNCSGTCAVLASDPMNCGACGNVCANVANGSVACVGGACVTTCDAGFHACGSACVSNASIATCGASCSPCGDRPNATTTCDGTSCGWSCNAGFHDCSGVCASNTDPATCGTRCSACTAGTNAVATCDGTNCGSTCAPGYHSCSGTCYADTDPAHCTLACMSCATPTGGVATCDGTNCGSTCPAGQHVCASGCVTNTSVATCGSSCTPCAAPANGTATCNGVSCGFTCNGGFMPMGTSCVPMAAPVCGNRIVETGETCDDGNTANNDGCNHNCAMESVTGTACGAPPLIVIADGGAHYYTGTTAGAGNDFGSLVYCPAAGPDQMYRIQFNTGRAFMYTVTVSPAPGSAWDVVLVHGSGCPVGGCTNATTSGDESYSFGFTNTAEINLDVDGAGATDAGPYVMRIDVTLF